MIVEATKELTDKHGNVLKPRSKKPMGGPDVHYNAICYWAAHYKQIADPVAREAKLQWLQAERAKLAEAAARRAFHARYGYAYQFPADAVANLEAGKGFIAEPKK